MLRINSFETLHTLDDGLKQLGFSPLFNVSKFRRDLKEKGINLADYGFELEFEHKFVNLNAFLNKKFEFSISWVNKNEE